MAFADIHWYSPTLAKQVGTYVLLPDTGKPPFPVLYLLHGLSDDHTIWHRRTRIESYVRELPLVVVMPDGFRGFYTDNDDGPAYAKYMAEDLPDFIERNFPAKPSRNARCIGGLSMGGYGALRLALGYPDRYVSAHSHSGALMRGTRQPAPGALSGTAEFRRVFGPDPRGSSHDLLHLAARARRQKKLPRLLIDCGQDDHLLDDNRAFHAELDRLKIPHAYREFPGGHNWDYWDTQIQSALAFHGETLRLH